MGTNPIDALDFVRAQRGERPINPYRIEGDPLSEEERSEQDLIAAMGDDRPGAGDEVTARPGGDGQAPPPSPLIPDRASVGKGPSERQRSPEAALATVQAMPQIAPDFIVLIVGQDVEAAVKGRVVSLSEHDAKAVKRILLQAWKREVMAELKAVRGARRRKAQTRTSPEPEVAAAPPVKRRGRPKGSKNRPKPESTGDAA